MKLFPLLLLAACGSTPAVVVSSTSLPKITYTEDGAPACIYKVKLLVYRTHKTVALKLDHCGYAVGDTIEVQ